MSAHPVEASTDELTPVQPDTTSTSRRHRFRIAFVPTGMMVELTTLCLGVPLLCLVTVPLSLLSLDSLRRLTPALVPAITMGSMLIGWLVYVVLSGFAAHLRMQAEQCLVLSRLDRRLTDSVDQLIEAVEKARALAPPADDLKAQQLAGCSQAIRSSQWAEAESIVQTFNDAHPGDPESTRLTEELAEAKNVARQELLTKLDAARQVNDPDRVIELRESVKPLIDLDALKSLDRDLAKWFMTLIQRRLRAGTVRPDVALLAGRVAASLDDTPEGASLRASLPTLRRAAGLCARCGQPYAGIADACPACISGAAASLPSTTDEPDEPE